MAELGASVFFVDLTDQNDAVNIFNSHLGRQAIKFVRQDVREIQEWPESIDCVYSQRMLGYLTYEDARQTLSLIKSRSTAGACFFLSAGGLNAEYGVEYSGRYEPIESRFGRLSDDMAAKHDIYAQQCLYTENELRKLTEMAGLKIQKSWTSTFGNPKIIAVNA